GEPLPGPGGCCLVGPPTPGRARRRDPAGTPAGCPGEPGRLAGDDVVRPSEPDGLEATHPPVALAGAHRSRAALRSRGDPIGARAARGPPRERPAAGWRGPGAGLPATRRG